jgi:hypothetical protein
MEGPHAAHSRARRERLKRRRQSNRITDAPDDTPARKRRLRGKCAPLRQCDRASLLVNLPGDQMPLLSEMVVDLGVN